MKNQMHYYEETEHGNIIFCGYITDEPDKGTILVEPAEPPIPKESEDYPEPEIGDILRFNEMPLDCGGHHATGYGVYNGITFEAEYDDEEDD